MNIKEKYKEILIDIITKYLPNSKIYLFGSRATQTHHEGSDIDLALDNKEKIELKIIFKIQDEIEQTSIPLFVDIVDINTTSEKLKNEILKEGILWKN
ncbi:MAG: nucleotidyltransferase domain-containing protein [bacterium]